LEKYTQGFGFWLTAELVCDAGSTWHLYEEFVAGCPVADFVAAFEATIHSGLEDAAIRLAMHISIIDNFFQTLITCGTHGEKCGQGFGRMLSEFANWTLSDSTSTPEVLDMTVPPMI
jgi:hypothetical protein